MKLMSFDVFSWLTLIMTILFLVKSEVDYEMTVYKFIVRRMVDVCRVEHSRFLYKKPSCKGQMLKTLMKKTLVRL